jgi:arylsulfatase A-like enzyme
VQLIDLMPTVLDLMRLAPPAAGENGDALAQLDGVSLMPLIRGEQHSVRPFSFSENEVFLAVQDTAAEGPRYKLVVGANANRSADLIDPAKAQFPPQLFRSSGPAGAREPHAR